MPTAEARTALLVCYHLQSYLWQLIAGSSAYQFLSTNHIMQATIVPTLLAKPSMPMLMK